MPQELRSFSDHWFVTNGVVAVGPLEFDRVSQGVAQGRIPATSFVRHTSWRVWQRLGDIKQLSELDRRETVIRLGGISATAEERANNPLSEAPPPLEEDRESHIENTSESQPPLSSVRPAAVNPVGVLSHAGDLDSALHLTLSTAVAAANADVGLLHCERPDLGAVVTSYALGRHVETLLGDRLAPDDPSVLAARAGHTVVGEPQLGLAGRYIAGRLARSIGTVPGLAMVPVLVFGRLVGILEVGREQSPFRAREVGRVEDVIEALSARIVVAGWVE
jgi:hypothetical protein